MYIDIIIFSTRKIEFFCNSIKLQIYEKDFN